MSNAETVFSSIGKFFMSESPLHQAMIEITQKLQEDNIDYVVVGGFALGIYGFVRATEDIDLLITRDGLEKFKSKWLGRGYIEIRSGGKPIRDTINNVRIDFLLTGEFPGDGKPKPIAFPHPSAVSVEMEKYRVISLSALIELKLASGMTAPYRIQDFADVMRLVQVSNLPLSFVETLNPYVRAKFEELWLLAELAKNNEE